MTDRYVALGARQRGQKSLIRMAKYLIKHENVRVVVDSTTADYLENSKISRYGIEVSEPNSRNLPVLAVAFGGDGAFIQQAALYAPHRVPMVGVNLGRIGFLADVPQIKMEKTISEILAGKFNDEKRVMLEIKHLRAKKLVAKYIVVNDVVIDRGAGGNLIWVEVVVNRNRSIHIRGDGILFATPGGSTAYNMAAGGPIIAPDAGCIVLTPLNPFSLTQRPLVFSSNYQFTVEVFGNTSARLVPDGQLGSALEIGDQIQVATHRRRMTLRHPQGYEYFDTLRQKLYWRD